MMFVNNSVQKKQNIMFAFFTNLRRTAHIIETVVMKPIDVVTNKMTHQLQNIVSLQQNNHHHEKKPNTLIH